MTGPGRAAEPPPSRWHESSFFLLLLCLCSGLTLWQFAGCMREGHCIFAEDFTVFYTPARMMLEGAASPYPVAEARAWIADPNMAGIFHYSLYPPSSLLLFYPLGLLACLPALGIWLGLQLLVLALSCRTFYARRMAFAANAGRNRRWLSFTLLLPFLLISLLAGQVGILCAALFVLTLAWRKNRPWAASLTLALLTLKPQLALVIPLLLLAERNVKVLLAAGVFTGLLAGASLLFFGAQVWRDYFRLLGLSHNLLAIAPPQLLKVSLSPAMALRMLGLPAEACLCLQAAFSLSVVLLLLRAFARAGEEGKLLLAATATFLISPYSFQYDAVLLAFPCLMLLKRWHENTLTPLQRMVLIALAFLPIIALKLQAINVPYGFIAILAGFALAQAVPSFQKQTP